jgi:hypothetical protein
MIKTITTLTLIFISLFSFGKVECGDKINKLTFEYINTYRTYNGVTKIKWDKSLSKISATNTNKLISLNKNGSGLTLSHSNTKGNYENCMGFIMNKKVGVGSPEFYSFVKEIFNIDKKDIDYNMFIALFSVYTWSTSESHNKNMLNKNHKSGSVNIKTTLFVFKSLELKKVLGTSNFK